MAAVSTNESLIELGFSLESYADPIYKSLNKYWKEYFRGKMIDVTINVKNILGPNCDFVALTLECELLIHTTKDIGL